MQIQAELSFKVAESNNCPNSILNRIKKARFRFNLSLKLQWGLRDFNFMFAFNPKKDFLYSQVFCIKSEKLHWKMGLSCIVFGLPKIQKIKILDEDLEV